MSMEKLQELINPSALMRLAPFWCLNDKLEKDEIIRQIHEMSEKGWGSFFMHARAGLVTGYLSDEWMEIIKTCVEEAEKLGMYAWLYDEDKWPSGFAGGIVPRKSEAFRARALVLLKKGTATEDDTVMSTVEHDGIEYEICKRVAPMGDSWFNETCFVDLMNPEAIREFINCTHEAYKKSCGEHFGKTIPGIFTDEPAYISWWICHAVPSVPWSEYFRDFFLKHNCYDILDKVEELFFDVGDYYTTRFNFYDAATELFKSSFTKQYYDWCEENNLSMTGHFMFEDSVRLQTQMSGDVMAHYEYMQWPGVDKLDRHINQVIVIKQLSSATDQLGKKRNLCEVFAEIGGNTSFSTRKWISDWLAVLGVNFSNQSLALYSMRGERKRDHPVNFFCPQPWWQDERGYADYQARLCAFAAEGKLIVDILLLQPLTSAWCVFSPLHKSGNFGIENEFDVPYEAITRKLLAEKLDFHYGNETLMSKYASVKDDSIAMGDYAYKCVIVPPSLNLRSSTVSLLQKYAEAGGKLIFVGMPHLIDGVAAEVNIPEAVVVESIEEAVKIVDEINSDRVSVIDLLSSKNADKVYVSSRSVESSTRHLIVNTDDIRTVPARIRIPQGVNTDMAVFDLYDGNIYKLDAVDGTFDVDLAPAGSLLVICGEEARENLGAPPSVLGSGAAFKSFIRIKPDVVIDTFDCEPTEENVMLLNNFALELDGKKVYEGPICATWHELFYPAEDGTAFKATYKFYSENEVEDCFAAIEVAENLDSITFNGAAVSPLKVKGEVGVMNPEKCWKDASFTKVPLPKIINGKNELVIEGKKVNNIIAPCSHKTLVNWKEHVPTELEEVYICGWFKIKKLSDAIFAISKYEAPSGKNLTYEGFPFYCGTVKYKALFNLDKISSGKVFLELNSANMASARIKINGEECGTLRWEPFVLDISKAVKAGKNYLEIEMATTMVNVLGPNRCAGIKSDIGVCPFEFIAMERFKDDYELFDFGLDSVGIIQENSLMEKF